MLMSDDVWTVGRLLTWTTEWLAGRESESPRLDAEVLLAHVRGCQRIELYTAFDTPVDDAQRALFRELVKRRGEGEPVAYLVGSREFFSLSFAVNHSVLVPRPETEGIVVRAIDLCRGMSAPKIVDVGTGSGAIAITLAKQLPLATFTATDRSADAMSVARANAERHGVSNRIEFIECDLLDDPLAIGPWDMIVSNPPYVREDEFDALPKDVRLHEPRGALVSGPTGVEMIVRLARAAAEQLVPGGWLIMEVGPARAAEAAILAQAGLEPKPTINDLAGLPRIVQARRM